MDWGWTAINLRFGRTLVNAAGGRRRPYTIHVHRLRSCTPMPTEPCAAVWDVDGTLVDTAELHFAAWERMAGEMGRPFTRADFAATFGRRNPEIIRLLFRREFADAE